MQGFSKQKIEIVLICVLAAIVYGIIHDEITAHLCVEYFTIAHPALFHTQSPAMLGLCWGVAATSGVGVTLGILLAEVSNSEGLPPYPLQLLCRSLLYLLMIMALGAFLAGLLGFELARHSLIRLPAIYLELIPSERQDRFAAVWFAHCASYLAGILGGSLLFLRIWRQRSQPPILTLLPHSRAAIIRALILAGLVAYLIYRRFSDS